MPRYVIRLQPIDPARADEVLAASKARHEAEAKAARAAPERRVIAVDASGWRDMTDFYAIVPPLLGMPARRGRDLDDLAKAMVGGEAGGVEPRYTLRIGSVAALAGGLAKDLRRLQEHVCDARRASKVERGHEIGVSVELLPYRGVRASDAERLTIDIDASRWVSRGDLYDTILPLLGAPDWHGRNMNALTESIVWGEINAIEPPYVLRVHGAANLAPGVAEELRWLEEGVTTGRAEFNVRCGQDVDVDVELLA